ncbi:MAG: hypothetical protein ACR2FF_06715 [Mycobacteriales bacterium]
MTSAGGAVVAIIADTALARKGLTYFADAAGVGVVDAQDAPEIVLRAPEAGSEVDAAVHIVVGIRSVSIEQRHPPTIAVVQAAARMVDELLTSWTVEDD